jgi:hypothetical protein
MSKHMPRLAVMVTALLAGGLAWAEEGTFEKRVAVDPKGVVDISNVAGTVKVTAWNRPEVLVEASYEEDVERIDVVTEGRRTRIKVVIARRNVSDGEAYLEVRMPETSDLEVSTVSAEIETNGVLGRLRLKSVSGNLETDLGSEAELNTVSGDVTLRGRGKPSDVRASTVSGNITLTRGAGVFDGTTTSGDLIVELEPVSRVRVRTVSGDLRLRGELTDDAEVTAETVSGELVARLGGKSGFEYEVTSFSGEIDSCFGRAERTSQYGPGMRLDGKQGAGNGSVRMKTMSGDIALCDR